MTNVFFLPPTPGPAARRPADRGGAAAARRAGQPRLGGRAAAGEPAASRAIDAASDVISVRSARRPEHRARCRRYRLASAVPPHWIPLLPVRPDPGQRRDPARPRRGPRRRRRPADSVRSQAPTARRPRRAAADPRGGGAAREASSSAAASRPPAGTTAGCSSGSPTAGPSAAARARAACGSTRWTARRCDIRHARPTYMTV